MKWICSKLFIVKVALCVIVKTLIIVKYIFNLNFIPVFYILAIYVPENSKKIGTCKYDNNKLSNLIKLNYYNRFHYRISIFILIFLHILLQLFAIIFTDNMFEIFNIEQLKEPSYPKQFQQSRQSINVEVINWYPCN